MPDEIIFRRLRVELVQAAKRISNCSKGITLSLECGEMSNSAVESALSALELRMTEFRDKCIQHAPVIEPHLYNEPWDRLRELEAGLHELRWVISESS